MHLLFAVLALASAEPPPEPTIENEIEVVAEKMYDMSVRLGLDDGGLTCRTLETSGDPEIDALTCQVYFECAAPEGGQAGSPEEEAKRIKKLLLNEGPLLECLEIRRKEAIRAFVTERRRQRS
jgi:hypothetical protein